MPRPARSDRRRIPGPHSRPVIAGSPIGAGEVGDLRSAIEAADADRPVSWVSVLPVRDTPVRLMRGRIEAVVADASDPLRFVVGLADLVRSAERQLARGVVLKVNYAHDPDPAAGDVLAVEIRDATLWAQVRWTPAGAQAVVDGEYDYTSVEFAWTGMDDPEEPADEVRFAGLALTNDPAFRGQVPIRMAAAADRSALVAAAAVDLGEDGTLDGLLASIKCAVHMAAGMGMFGGQDGWVTYPDGGAVTPTHVRLGIEGMDGTSWWQVAWSLSAEGHVLLTEPTPARMLFVTEMSQAHASSGTAGPQGRRGRMTIDELKATLEGDALAAVEAVVAERDAALAASAAAPAPPPAAESSDLADVLDQVAALRTEIDTLRATAADSEVRAQASDRAAYEARARLLGVPASLREDADAAYARGGMAAVETACARWGKAGLLVPVGAGRRSDGSVPAMGDGPGPAREALALIDTIKARDKCGTGDAIRRLRAERPDLHPHVAGVVAGRA